MFVCICNSLRDQVCRETAASGACRGPGCIYRLNGARVRCGRCVPRMRELYRQHAQQADAPAGTGAASAA